MYVDFECNLESIESYEGSYSKGSQDHIPCSFAYKVVCVDDKFNKIVVVFRGEKAAYGFIKAIIKEFEHCKKVMKKHFNKNLIMTVEKEEQFQLSKMCWICEKGFKNHDEKVKYHCYISQKYKGSALWNCNKSSVNWKSPRNVLQFKKLWQSFNFL